MKGLIVFVLISNLALAINSFAQNSDEALIRKLEDTEREAILRGDTLQLYRLMSNKIVVHNPENTIVGLRTIMDRIKGGKRIDG